MRTPAFSLCIAVFALLAGIAVPRSVTAGVTDSLRQRIAFEANRGQTDDRVQFLARASTYTLFLTQSEAVLALGRGRHEPTAVRIRLVGARESSRIVGTDPLSGRVNYFKRGDSTDGVADIPTFAAVKHVGVYPGVDVVYYGHEGQIEYDFVLVPGADPDAILLAFDGADSLTLNAAGDLVVRTRAGELRQRRPVIYQDVDGGRRQIPGSYVLKDSQHVAIRVGAYDPSQPLVIDPVLVYSTYLGGSSDDTGHRIAVDGAGNAYVTGTATSVDFPTTAGTDRTLGGSQDAFVAKFSPTGALIYSTYLGGPCDDEGRGIAADAAGNAYVTGRIGLCLDDTMPPGALVAKLDPTGAVVYFFTLGGSLADTSVGQAIAVDAAGNAYVAGLADSSSRDFPTTPGAFRTTDCNGFLADAFIAKVNPAGTALVYSTYLCGTDHESLNALAIDSAGNAYVAGSTASHDFPTVNAHQPTHNGGPVGVTGFVAKLNSTGSALVYSTYLGGTFADRALGIAVDAQGNAYVSGDTDGGDFPTTPGVVQQTAPFPICLDELCTDAFVAKFSPTGTLIFSTYVAGEGNDTASAIAVDGAGNVYVAGSTASIRFPVKDAFQWHNRGLTDVFVVKLNSDASRILYSTYLGGGKPPGSTRITEGADSGIGIALDPNGNVYVSGYTVSPDFPTTAGAFQRNPGGGTCFALEPCGDAFVAKISAGGPGITPPIHLDITPTEVPPGGTVTASWGGIPAPSSRDELVLYPLGERADDTTALAVFPTTGAAAGALPLALPPTLLPGTYELRLLNPSPEAPALLDIIARSQPIYVTSPTLSVMPTAPSPGAMLTATWSGIATPAATDWIGLFPQGAPNTALVDWIYVSCSKASGVPRAAGSCVFGLPTNLAPGTYELRLFANNGFTRLATSGPITVGAAGPTLAASPDSVAPGGNVTATWSGIGNPTTADWIALFAHGATDTALLDWMYVSCSKAPGAPRAAGSCAFGLPTNLAPGTYELRLFANNGFTRLATSGPITVGTVGPTLAASPNSVAPGGNVTATWSGIGNPTAADWIALFAQGAPDTVFLDWMYVSCSKAQGTGRAAGSCALVLPTNLAPGTYELRLFANNGFTRLATSGPITVDAAGPTLAASPTNLAPGGSVTATWSGIGNPTAADWIALFTQGAADSAFLDWMYVSCSKASTTPRTQGSCAFGLPITLPPGSYELRLFANNGFTRLATSGPINVTPAGPTIAATPTTVPRGGTVTATWSGIVNPTAVDWIAVFAQNAPDTTFADWIYVSCSKTPGSAHQGGSCAFVLPTTLAPGMYELRLFANNGFTRLATSSPISVTSP